MSLASRISSFFTTSSTTSPDSPSLGSLNRGGGSNSSAVVIPASTPGSHEPAGAQQHGLGNMAVEGKNDDLSSRRAPYLHSMIAGGFGGATGDMMMHSLDTVKTRQQGAPSVLKYSTMGDAYTTIFREEGFRRGLYGGVAPAFMGSLPGTMIFFGTYEYSKRNLLDMGCPDAAAYLIGGLAGDLFASVIYVPSEVLKTRLQLQGRYNNPYFKSGYNYRGTIDATRTIIRTEGFPALFYGYKATIMRDLPFSALQFAFYEEFQKWAKSYQNSRDIGIGLEILTGGAAGGLAGVITCPLDVVKTRIQTQVRTEPGATIIASNITPSAVPVTNLSLSSPHHATTAATAPSAGVAQQQHRKISTSSPSTTPPPKPGTTTVKLSTNSIYKGLGLIYRTEGIQGCFRGVGPRMVWTSVQSGTMLVLYQSILKRLDAWWPWEAEGDALN